MNQKERFDLVVSLGETLLSNGGEIFRTNDLMQIAARQYGIEQFNTFTIANGVFVSALLDGRQYASKVRHIPLTATHLGRVEAMNELSRRIAAGEVSPEQAREAVGQIRRIRGAGIPAQILAAAVGSGTFCLLFGGNGLDSAASAAAGLLLCCFMKLACPRFQLPKVLSNLLGAALASLFCCLFWKCGLGTHVDKIIIGTIFQLVPGIPFTNAVRNFMENDFLAGLVRLMDAFLTAGCISAGVGIALALWGACLGGIAP